MYFVQHMTAIRISNPLTNTVNVISAHSHSKTRCSAHFKLMSHFQHICEHSTSANETYTCIKSNVGDITTHHWLGRLGVARVLLRGSRGGGGIGGLGLGGGLGGRWAAVRHGQLTQVGGV